jgi:deoxyribodipyrimidine photo-lyase
MEKITLFWFRRDLRLHDNAGLYFALKEQKNVLPIFIFDTDILCHFENKKDPRVTFIYDTLIQIKKTLSNLGSSLYIGHGTPLSIFQQLKEKYPIHSIYTNQDYEPSAIQRDLKIETWAKENGIQFHSYKDQVIFEKKEILNDSGLPYRVYTPYKRKWLSQLNNFYLKAYPTEKYFSHFSSISIEHTPSLEDIGFLRGSIHIPTSQILQKVIRSYDQTRDYPAVEDGTSKLGIHFRFGTISVREKARKALELNQTWLSELIWREFFMQLLFHFPEVVHQSFNRKFDVIQWRNDAKDFQLWCQGKTGYPLVDAGMRELNTTGHMHNRVRMVVASFLTKHLFIDWRWGEAYFAQKLLDYDLSANNGNWQWCAGTGADAQPYFRIFNPIAQQEKFDPEFKYIKKWVPEYGTSAYISPMIDHKTAVQRAKNAFSILAKN